MKRVYFTAIFIMFLLFIVISINFASNPITGGAVIPTYGLVPKEFSSFGMVASALLAITSYFFIKSVKKED